MRSIRVYHVQYAQRTTGGGEDDSGEECERRDTSRLGVYGAQGEFRWHEMPAGSIPTGPGYSAFVPPENCRWYRYRSVAVSWTDALGAPRLRGGALLSPGLRPSRHSRGACTTH